MKLEAGGWIGDMEKGKHSNNHELLISMFKKNQMEFIQ